MSQSKGNCRICGKPLKYFNTPLFGDKTICTTCTRKEAAKELKEAAKGVKEGAKESAEELKRDIKRTLGEIRRTSKEDESNVQAHCKSKNENQEPKGYLIVTAEEISPEEIQKRFD